MFSAPLTREECVCASEINERKSTPGKKGRKSKRTKDECLLTFKLLTSVIGSTTVKGSYAGCMQVGLLVSVRMRGVNPFQLPSQSLFSLSEKVELLIRLFPVTNDFFPHFLESNGWESCAARVDGCQTKLANVLDNF